MSIVQPGHPDKRPAGQQRTVPIRHTGDAKMVPGDTAQSLRYAMMHYVHDGKITTHVQTWLHLPPAGPHYTQLKAAGTTSAMETCLLPYPEGAA